MLEFKTSNIPKEDLDDSPSCTSSVLFLSFFGFLLGGFEFFFLGGGLLPVARASTQFFFRVWSTNN